MSRLALVLLTLVCCLVSRAQAAGPEQRLAEAVRYKTISYQDQAAIDYREFERFQMFLRKSFPRVFSALEVETVAKHSLLLRWPGSEPELPGVLFTAHSDVVPIEPGTEREWDQPPFAGLIAQGRIYGRGTLDDKQGLMGLLEAAETLLEEEFTPRRTIVLAFGHDEEIGGTQGAANIGQLMRERGWRFAWMVDEGGMVMQDNPLLPGKAAALINIAEKAYVTLTLVATGEGGHSSQPPKDSTIGRLSRALAKIEANPFPARLVEPVEAMLQALAPHVSQPTRLVFNNLWLTRPLVLRQMSSERLTNAFVRTTTALTMFNAGVKENVVPQRAEAKVNFRLLPGITPEQVVEYITQVVDDPSIAIEHDEWHQVPGVADHKGEGFRVIAEAVTAVYPDIVVLPSLLIATTDTRHYVDLAQDQLRFHGVSMDASQASSIHGTNEYITIESYLASIDIARRMIQGAAL